MNLTINVIICKNTQAVLVWNGTVFDNMIRRKSHRTSSSVTFFVIEDETRHSEDDEGGER